MSDELIGQSLGQYQIRVLLGKGGMSTVYLAYQPSMDRTVAIKVLPREFLHDTTFLTRFQQEGRTIAKLEHLHILPVYDFGEHDGIPYIVMRYLAGGTLADLIFGRLPPLATTVRLIGQVADALDYAHGRGIIHRDLKPSNVLLDNSDNAYLADFGIARVTQAAQAANLTGSRVIGTPPYIAPEMVKKDQKITPSVDIYALGIIAFEMLTGQTPFYDEDSMKVLMAHVLEPVPSARVVDPTISQEVDAVVMRCLAKTPQQRFKTATDFATELAHVAATSAHGQAVSSTPPPKPPDTPPRLRAQPQPVPQPSSAPAEGSLEDRESSRGWLFALVAAGALIMGIVLIAFVLIGGNALGLTRLFGANRATPTPTVTPTPSSSSPTTIPMATILPPPSSGNRLVFTSTRDGDWDLYLIDSDGTNLRQITHDSGMDYDPAWSPDGIRIAYASSTSDGTPDIKIITIACVLSEQSCDESARNLTNHSAKDYGPAWSPDGQYIAFTSDREGNLDIYTMRADGTEVKRLTFNSDDDQAPHWSPDGTRIVYYAEDGNLYTIAASGGIPQQLTDSPEIDKWPDWSPDSLFIAYTATSGQTGSRHGILTIELATRTLAQLTSGLQDDDPAWSPDGTHIAYDADPDGDGDFDLVVLEITSGVIDRLTSEHNNAAPDWQPQQ